MIPQGCELAVRTGYSVNVPVGVSLPMLFPRFASVNQRLPSGPAVIPVGAALPVGTVNSVSTPAVVMLPILFPECSLNQTLPSGPDVIPKF